MTRTSCHGSPASGRRVSRGDGTAHPRRARGPPLRPAPFPSGTTGLLDVNWLTPAKRRQLNVVGEEGMFELDYLTQRLTFTSARTSAPDMIKGYAPRSRVTSSGVDSRSRATGRRAGRVHRGRAGRRAAGLDGEDGLWAVAIASPCSSGRGARAGRVRLRGAPARGRTNRHDASPSRPTSVAAERSLGGSIDLPSTRAARSRPGRCKPWTGEPDTAGTVTVVGAGKMGMPLAAQFASHGWRVIAVDATRRSSRRSTTAGLTSPGAGPRRARRRRACAGLLRATLDGGEAAAAADVVVLIVPVVLDEEQQPDYRYMDAAVASIRRGCTRADRHLRDNPPGRRHARSATCPAWRRQAG